MTEHNERAGIYARSATDNPDSIDRQRAAVRAHAVAHGYDIVEEYTDNGVSGNSSPFERSGLGAPLSNPDRWDTLVTYSLDRVSRDFTDLNELEDWLTAHDKTLETVGGLRFPPRINPHVGRPRNATLRGRSRVRTPAYGSGPPAPQRPVRSTGRLCAGPRTAALVVPFAQPCTPRTERPSPAGLVTSNGAHHEHHRRSGRAKGGDSLRCARRRARRVQAGGLVPAGPARWPRHRPPRGGCGQLSRRLTVRVFSGAEHARGGAGIMSRLLSVIRLSDLSDESQPVRTASGRRTSNTPTLATTRSSVRHWTWTSPARSTHLSGSPSGRG